MAILFFQFASAAAGDPVAGDAPDTHCAGLRSLVLADTQITLAEPVPAGQFTPPDTTAAGTSLSSQARQAERASTALPPPDLEVTAFCRIAGTIEPAINFEVWMPAHDWNGKFNGVGLGGYLGAINYNSLAFALARGYATASTDAGHRSASNATAWAIGNQEAIVSLGHRAHHEMTVRAKAIIAAFYGTGPRYSYFTGCSSGGWQGLTEAQRYPGDYDGIVSGAPAINVVHLHAGSIWNAFQARKIAAGKFAVVAEAVIAACDAADGVADRLIQNPPDCGFDPATLQCAGRDDGACLTADEVQAFRNMYAGARDPAGRQVYPGWPISTERGLAVWADPAFLGFVAGTFKDLAYQGDAGWDVEKFDFGTDVARADARIGQHLNSNDPDLRGFQKRGGKLILYHGWDDALVPASATIDYYQRVTRVVAGEGDNALAATADFARLYLGAGMGHCSGLPGPGPHVVDALTALENWVERGQAPDRIVAANPANGMHRPLCPYPQQARYAGTGSTDDDSRFQCVAGRLGNSGSE